MLLGYDMPLMRLLIFKTFSNTRRYYTYARLMEYLIYAAKPIGSVLFPNLYIRKFKETDQVARLVHNYLNRCHIKLLFLY